ncbi:hypothetical protein LTR85_001507 [Meristemomyces frigidus]|nr:hypothetical protein LTR85_001507 [Meristemomyces frigidus]
MDILDVNFATQEEPSQVLEPTRGGHEQTDASMSFINPFSDPGLAVSTQGRQELSAVAHGDVPLWQACLAGLAVCTILFSGLYAAFATSRYAYRFCIKAQHALLAWLDGRIAAGVQKAVAEKLEHLRDQLDSQKDATAAVKTTNSNTINSIVRLQKTVAEVTERLEAVNLCFNEEIVRLSSNFDKATENGERKYTDLHEHVGRLDRQQASNKGTTVRLIDNAMSGVRAEISAMQAKLNDLKKGEEDLEGRIGKIKNEGKELSKREAETGRMAVRAVTAVAGMKNDVNELAATVRYDGTTVSRTAVDSKQSLSMVAKLEAATGLAMERLKAEMQSTIANMQTQQAQHRDMTEAAINGVSATLSAEIYRLQGQTEKMSRSGAAAAQDIAALMGSVNRIDGTLHGHHNHLSELEAASRGFQDRLYQHHIAINSQATTMDDITTAARQVQATLQQDQMQIARLHGDVVGLQGDMVRYRQAPLQLHAASQGYRQLGNGMLDAAGKVVDFAELGRDYRVR